LRIGDPTALPTDPTLSHVLERLHGIRSVERARPVETLDLYFLRHVDRPGVLGMLGEYEVTEVIGQGGMGVVLKAFEPSLHRQVAIKVMAPAVAGSSTARQRFLREAKAAAAVCHDHVVTVHAVSEEDGLPYLVMHFVEGESLQDRLDRLGPLEVVDVVRIGLQTAMGLAAAHAHGLIHRDIKPANLLLENDLARVKITDFGLARMTDDAALTQNGVLAGTPEYMAPEQARGEKVDHRADLFSLGSVLHAACTGQPPFRGSTTLAVLRQVSEQTAPGVREVNAEIPSWLEALISRLMAMEPSDRFQRAAEVVTLLEGYLAHLREPAAVLPPSMPAPRIGNSPDDEEVAKRSLRPASVVRWVAPGIVLVAAALVSWAWLSYRQDQDAEEARTGQPNNAGGAMRGEQVYDFRDRPIPAGVSPLSGGSEKYTKVESEGLRITLPKDREDFPSPAFSMTLEVEGDFEITVTFDILHVDRPARGAKSYGLGLMMSVNETFRIGCLERAEGTVAMWDRWDTVGGQRKLLTGAFPSTSQKGRLRLARSSNKLSFLWSPEFEGDRFQEIGKCNIGGETITDLRLELVTNLGGGKKGELDLRLIELGIRGSNFAADRIFASAEERAVEARNHLIVPLVVGLAITLTIPVAWLLVRCFRRTEVTNSSRVAAASKATKPGSPVPTISICCSGCGKALRGKSELAGKKVKCPQCGTAVTLAES
jgi:serine/threonine protein kinase